MVSLKKLTNEQLAAIMSAPETVSSADLARLFDCTTITIDNYRIGGWFSPIFVLPCRDWGEPVIAHTKTKVCRECKRRRQRESMRQRYREHPPVHTEFTREQARQRTRQWYVEHHKPRAEPPGLMTTAQVAERFGISPGGVIEFVASGQLQAKLKTAHRSYFDPLEVERYTKVRQANTETRYGAYTPGLLTRKQVAARLGLSRRRVDQLIADGRLVSVEPNTRYLRFEEAQVERFAAVKRRKGKPPLTWTDEEDRIILRDPKRSARLIALELGRSQSVVSQRRLELRASQHTAPDPTESAE